jgi:probable rRNA maturation factor
MIHFNIDTAYRGQGLQKPLSKAAEAALAHAGSEKCSLTVVITGNKRLKELNQQFRGIDEATDVLSFPSDANRKDEARYMGDVIISHPRARSQAKAAGHSLVAELQLLLVHGILHLLGHDHADRSSKAKMWAAQDEILHGLGIHIDVDRAVAAHSGS